MGRIEGKDRAQLTILQSLLMPLSAHEKAAQNRRTPKRYRENDSDRQVGRMAEMIFAKSGGDCDTGTVQNAILRYGRLQICVTGLRVEMSDKVGEELGEVGVEQIVIALEDLDGWREVEGAAKTGTDAAKSGGNAGEVAVGAKQVSGLHVLETAISFRWEVSATGLERGINVCGEFRQWRV